jgi:hypothetical protein
MDASDAESETKRSPRTLNTRVKQDAEATQGSNAFYLLLA